MKRSPLPNRKTPLKRTSFKRHGRKSARKVARLREWIIEKDRAWAECGGQCVGRVDGICTKIASQPHHFRKRSLGGNNEPICLWLCAACHDFCEREPRKAAALGLVDLRKAA